MEQNRKSSCLDAIIYLFFKYAYILYDNQDDV